MTVIVRKECMVASKRDNLRCELHIGDVEFKLVKKFSVLDRVS